MIARALLLLACLALPGCLTSALITWSSAEVTVRGTGYEGHDALRIEVKNVEGWVEGSYDLFVPPFEDRPVVRAADGVLEIQPLHALEVTHDDSWPTPYAVGKPFWAIGSSAEVDALVWPADRREPLHAPVGAYVERDGRSFRVHALRLDPELERWVRMGVAEIGPGTQSRARPLALVAYPVTLVVDILTTPIAIFALWVEALTESEESPEEGEGVGAGEEPG